MAKAKQHGQKRRSPLSSPGRGKRRGLSAGAWFEKLVALQKRLRQADGCPWDRQQTHATLKTYLIEEAYEVLDALESGDNAKFVEELGDLLLQVVFHSQIATEGGRFQISDVIREVHEKLVRRHPHVFGAQRARDAAEVLKTWEQIKAQERRTASWGRPLSAKEPGPASLIDGVPHSLPATLQGWQLTKKAARIGFDWSDACGIFDKMREEATELQHAIEARNARKIEEELGDLLFAVVNLARFLEVDPEIALKRANAKFSRRFRNMERLARDTQRELGSVSRDELEALWDAAKRQEQESAANERILGQRNS